MCEKITYHFITFSKLYILFTINRRRTVDTPDYTPSYILLSFDSNLFAGINCKTITCYIKKAFVKFPTLRGISNSKADKVNLPCAPNGGWN